MAGVLGWVVGGIATAVVTGVLSAALVGIVERVVRGRRARRGVYLVARRGTWDWVGGSAMITDSSLVFTPRWLPRTEIYPVTGAAVAPADDRYVGVPAGFTEVELAGPESPVRFCVPDDLVAPFLSRLAATAAGPPGAPPPPG